MEMDIRSELFAPAQQFFDFAASASFSSQRHASISSEWVRKHDQVFRAPSRVVLSLSDQGVESQPDARMPPLTALALPWLEGDLEESVAPQHIAAIKRQCDLATALCDKLVRIVSAAEGESTPGAQFSSR